MRRGVCGAIAWAIVGAGCATEAEDPAGVGGPDEERMTGECPYSVVEVSADPADYPTPTYPLIVKWDEFNATTDLLGNAVTMPLVHGQVRVQLYDLPVDEVVDRCATETLDVQPIQIITFPGGHGDVSEGVDTQADVYYEFVPGPGQAAMLTLLTEDYDALAKLVLHVTDTSNLTVVEFE